MTSFFTSTPKGHEMNKSYKSIENMPSLLPRTILWYSWLCKLQAKHIINPNTQTVYNSGHFKFRPKLMRYPGIQRDTALESTNLIFTYKFRRYKQFQHTDRATSVVNTSTLVFPFLMRKIMISLFAHLDVPRTNPKP
uniref:Uncharacterized protein n=1 Tax=Opuntia streptacantha TaxID=393608 RepID=A0A7C9DYE0_OPUST